MCGITGFIGRGSADDLRRMNNTLTRRGPDQEGYFSDPAGRAFLGSRRLAIIDLAGGQQPIANEDGTVIVVLNGEIYNYRELREALEDVHTFRTKTDTEAIVHLYEEAGETLADKLEGMFAFAIWDSHLKKLLLARDRFGEKPLYYAHGNGTFTFGSEIKALLAHPSVSRELDREALAQYLQYEAIPAPYTIFSGIRNLPAGHLATLQEGKMEIRRYWDIAADRDAPAAAPHTEQEYIEALDGYLDRAVEKMLVADVPLGVFLSGGIDSSTVAFYAQRATRKKINTFSIGFQEESFDESPHAARVAERLGTSHTAALFSERELLDVLPPLYAYLDEPLADPSLLPTALLSRAARQHVTVALGGDGADELFFGYPTFLAEKIFRWYRPIPRGLREGLIRPLVNLLPSSSRYMSIDYRLKRFVRSAGLAPEARHAAWIGAFSKEELPKLLADGKSGAAAPPDEAPLTASAAEDRLRRAGLFYLSQYLPDDILAKVDRASMFYSLEVRAPFLDPALASFIFSLPTSYKLRGLRTKYLLKRLMAPRLGKDIAYRKKHGFQPPISRWLRHELSDLVREHLNPDTLRKDGIFNPEYVTRLIDLHQKGKRDCRKELWTLLVFQLWKSHWYK